MKISSVLRYKHTECQAARQVLRQASVAVAAARSHWNTFAAPPDGWEWGWINFGASPYTQYIKTDAPLDAGCVYTLKLYTHRAAASVSVADWIPLEYIVTLGNAGIDFQASQCIPIGVGIPLHCLTFLLLFLKERFRFEIM